MNQTALVIVIPEGETRFGEMRRKYDPQANLGVPAHVTVLFPFMPPELVDSQTRRRLKLLFKRHSPFVCQFPSVGRFPFTTYLAPTNSASFIELTRAVFDEFPQYPPYGGTHAGVFPHLTIADGNANHADAAERELGVDLADHGPVIAHCRSVKLLENSTGRWGEMDEFALVGHQG